MADASAAAAMAVRGTSSQSKAAMVNAQRWGKGGGGHRGKRTIPHRTCGKEHKIPSPNSTLVHALHSAVTSRGDFYIF